MTQQTLGRTAAQPDESWHAIEWPTLTLIAATYAAWVALLFCSTWLPWPLIAVLGSAVVCLHGSLQHEVVHGHPTPWQGLNQLLVALPIALWLPFLLYRREHRKHHAVSELTCPNEDPESAYVSREQWQRLPAFLKGVLNLNQTLLGRVTLGPFIVCFRAWWSAVANCFGGRPADRAIWLRHVLTVCFMLWVINAVFAIPAHHYALLFALPGLSLTLVRSFIEHQPGDDGNDATVTVASRGPLAFLFLYNNFHWWHHQEPTLSWFRLASVAREGTRELPRTARVLNGYGQVLRQYALHRRDKPWR